MADPDTLPAARLRYSLTTHNPESHLVDVCLTIEEADELTAGRDGLLTVKMAAWCPGSYVVRDYARFVRDVRAADGAGSPLAIEKTSKLAWTIATGGAKQISVRYSVYGYDLSVRTNHIDSSHAFLHGPATYLFVDQRRTEPCDIEVSLPPGRDWTIATGLERRGPTSSFRARDIDNLLDCPLHLGETDVRRFEAAGVPFELAVWGRPAPGVRDLDDLVADLIPIIEGHAARFGGVPFDRYTFILMLSAKAYGGLEHKNSSANLASTLAFAKDSTYWDLLELLSHEFFHVWNGKRIYPAAFAPFDYERENYTRCLWVVEGLTSYYDRYTILRSGPLTSRRYLEKLAEEWGRLTSTPGRHRHSLESSSFDAWIKLYKPDPSNLNTTVSYYLKGGLVATTLDLWIRRHSGGKRSLANILSAMWRLFGSVDQGYPEDVEAVFSEAAGIDLSEPFRRWVVGNEDPDLVTELSHAGLTLTTSNESGPDTVYLGVQTSEKPLRVSSVLDDSPASRAGLSPGDQLLAIDRRQLQSATDLRKALAAQHPGDTAAIAVFRRSLLLEIDVELAPSPPRGVQLATTEGATEAQKIRFSEWLDTEWPTEPLSVSTTSKRWT